MRCPLSVRAFVLIETQVGHGSDVAREIRALPGVVAADDVTGPYDIIATAEANSVDELGRMVIGRLQQIEGIRKTLTCPILNLTETPAFESPGEEELRTSLQ